MKQLYFKSAFPPKPSFTIADGFIILGLTSMLYQGDFLLAPLGKAYAEASILARKEMLAGRVLRMPVIAWIYESLRRDDSKRLAWEYFLNKLSADFGDKAEDELDIAISWGRHAELFAYDDDTGDLYLE